MIKVDSKKLQETLRKLNVHEIADRALYRVGADILADAQDVPPKPPIDFGDLRGSASIAVNSEVLLQGPEAPDTNMPEDAVRIGFNTSYALRLHERTDWNPVPKAKAPGEESKVGPFWLTNKVNKYKDKYISNFAKYLSKEIVKWLT